MGLALTYNGDTHNGWVRERSCKLIEKYVKEGNIVTCKIISLGMDHEWKEGWARVSYTSEATN